MGRDYVLSAVLVLGVACRGASAPLRTSELRVVSSAAYSTRTASEFHARIGADRSIADDAAPDSSLQAWVSLRLRGDEFEYHIRLRNPAAFQVTEAVVASVADPERVMTPVMVLFRDARYRDRFLEVRGLGVVLPSMLPSTIAEEIQGRPSAFAVLLKGPGGERWMAPLAAGR